VAELAEATVSLPAELVEALVEATEDTASFDRLRMRV